MEEYTWRVFNSIFAVVLINWRGKKFSTEWHNFCKTNWTNSNTSACRMYAKQIRIDWCCSTHLSSREFQQRERLNTSRRIARERRSTLIPYLSCLSFDLCCEEFLSTLWLAVELKSIAVCSQLSHEMFSTHSWREFSVFFSLFPFFRELLTVTESDVNLLLTLFRFSSKYTSIFESIRRWRDIFFKNEGTFWIIVRLKEISGVWWVKDDMNLSYKLFDDTSRVNHLQISTKTRKSLVWAYICVHWVHSRIFEFCQNIISHLQCVCIGSTKIYQNSWISLADCQFNSNLTKCHDTGTWGGCSTTMVRSLNWRLLNFSK